MDSIAISMQEVVGFNIDHASNHSDLSTLETKVLPTHDDDRLILDAM